LVYQNHFMLKVENNSEWMAMFQNLKLAVLSIQHTEQESKISVNDSFISIFLQNQDDQISKESFYKGFLAKIQTDDDIYSHGTCYQIDKIKDGITNHYLFTPSFNSVQQSFLWLKHDLLNILNPIMGFSEFLMESESISKEDIELVDKIHQNSQLMFTQLDQLSILQKISILKHQVHADDYSVGDFMKEMIDTLIINKQVDTPPQLNIQTDKLIYAKLANHDLRAVLENQILYFLSWQESRKLDFNISIKDDQVMIQIEFYDNNIPQNYLDELVLLEKFAKECHSIDKLHSPGLNYLILIQVVDILQGKVKINKNTQIIPLGEMIFPITKLQTKAKGEKSNNPHSDFSNIKKKAYQINLPKDEHQQMQKLCNSFDGLIILDDWEEFALKIEEINSTIQNDEIEKLIQEIRTAIRLFDLDKLKKIHSDCKSAFPEA